jgi:nucleotide-binding universal stress UspA family protein
VRRIPARIVVGVDGTDQSRDALELARELAPALDAEISAAAVLQCDPVEALDRAPYEAALQTHFDEILELSDEQLQGLALERHRLRGASPAAELAKLAARLEACLLIVGSTDQGALGRVYPGSVGTALLSGSPCPVAIAPHGYAGGERSELELVGVGYDGRREARAALDFAEPLAADLGARIELIAGVSYRLPLRSELASPLDARGAERERLAEVLELAAASLPASTATTLAGTDPVELLVERSGELDLLVLGSRGYGPLKRALLGGVTIRVIRKGRCPIVVVPRSATGDPNESQPPTDVALE